MNVLRWFTVFISASVTIGCATNAVTAPRVYFPDRQLTGDGKMVIYGRCSNEADCAALVKKRNADMALIKKKRAIEVQKQAELEQKLQWWRSSDRWVQVQKTPYRIDGVTMYRAFQSLEGAELDLMHRQCMDLKSQSFNHNPYLMNQPMYPHKALQNGMNGTVTTYAILYMHHSVTFQCMRHNNDAVYGQMMNGNPGLVVHGFVTSMRKYESLGWLQFDDLSAQIITGGPVEDKRK